jgi:methylenetetrahydrofolate reductase (NADPH)
MIETQRDLREHGRLRGGGRVDPPPRLFIGTTASPLSGELEDSFAKLRRKVEAGADFVQTQGVFDVEAFEEWVHLLRKEWLHERVHILAGVMPLKSAKAARFVNEKIAGAVVPEEVVARLDRASSPKTEGVRIAVEAIEGLRKVEGVHGVHIMAVGWEDAVPAIVREAGLHPRPDAWLPRRTATASSAGELPQSL